MNDDDDLLMCNCAGCGVELLGRSNPWTAKVIKRVEAGELPERCAGRMLGRPYCADCLALRERTDCRAMDNAGRRASKTTDEWNGSADDAVKAMEG